MSENEIQKEREVQDRKPIGPIGAKNKTRTKKKTTKTKKQKKKKKKKKGGSPRGTLRELEPLGPAPRLETLPESLVTREDLAGEPVGAVGVELKPTPPPRAKGGPSRTVRLVRGGASLPACGSESTGRLSLPTMNLSNYICTVKRKKIKFCNFFLLLLLPVSSIYTACVLFHVRSRNIMRSSLGTRVSARLSVRYLLPGPGGRGRRGGGGQI